MAAEAATTSDHSWHLPVHEFPQQTANIHNKKAAPPADTGKAAFDIYLSIRSITTPLHKRSLTV